MNYNRWPKRSAEKNYFMVPNEVFGMGLDYREISLYTYLLRCEDRETYQCYPSYKTIGNALGMCENTVAKYVRQLEDKGLIYTEPTLIRSKDGKPLNGNLRYTIRPIQGAIELFYERQFRQVVEDAALYRAKQRLESLSPRAARTPRVRLFLRRRVPAPPRDLRADWTLFRRRLQGRKKKQDKDLASQATACPPLLPAVRAVPEVWSWRLWNTEKAPMASASPKTPCYRAFQGCLTAKRRN